MDTKELEREIRRIVRVGKVSAVYPEKNAARVVFEDKDNTVSAELRMLHRGAKRNKDFWLPDEGDEVVCIFSANDKHSEIGWIIGAHFNEENPPQVKSADIMRIDFGDGGYIEYDRKNSALNIHCPGTIRITGGNIYLNE